MTTPNNSPDFSLVFNQSQAEAALAALVCFGNQQEKDHFKTEALKLKRESLHQGGNICLVEKVNELIANYIQQCGELSDQLIIFISKSLKS